MAPEVIVATPDDVNRFGRDSSRFDYTNIGLVKKTLRGEGFFLKNVEHFLSYVWTAPTNTKYFLTHVVGQGSSNSEQSTNHGAAANILKRVAREYLEQYDIHFLALTSKAEVSRVTTVFSDLGCKVERMYQEP
jgi:hypothetical protein